MITNKPHLYNYKMYVSETDLLDKNYFYNIILEHRTQNNNILKIKLQK